MKPAIIILFLLLSIQNSWAQDTLSHCGPYAVPISSNADVWSAITLFNRDSGDFNNVHGKYIGQLHLLMFDQASLAVVTLRVWEGTKVGKNGEGKPEITDFGKKVYQQNITASLTYNSQSSGSAYSIFILPEGITINDTLNYAIEAEVAQTNHSQPAIGADTGAMVEGRGGWLVNYEHPNGIQLRELDPQLADRNWNIRAVTRNVQLALKEIAKEIPAVGIFPNPVQNLLHINLSVDEPTPAEVQLFNEMGELVYSQKENLSIGGNSWEVNIADLPNGIYMCRIRTSQWLTTRRIIKAI